MSDLITGLATAGGAQLLLKWRGRARVRNLRRGGSLSAPCALRIVDGDKARWRQGRATTDQGTVVWRARAGNAQIVLRRDGVRLLSVRSPTARESWTIRHDLVIHRLRTDDDLVDIALLPAEAPYFREALGLPEL
ncbi:DUF2550 family protein [Actinacidiphila acidipaludis]|uniref:DUF2550 family protein n=1 Tax=Actinacidiphila acidipaludis TaxID=2873382 RepID=A0ABS7Q0V3_9ACTN|nr:DUF2550 family protein [Streptomyces acidipaludis]MBY8876075.1 DUF2550 family protein [Streptomyces acidipaludis]